MRFLPANPFVALAVPAAEVTELTTIVKLILVAENLYATIEVVDIIGNEDSSSGVLNLVCTGPVYSGVSVLIVSENHVGQVRSCRSPLK